MDVLPAAIRDRLAYSQGYLSARSLAFPTSPSEIYGTVLSKVTTLLALPLPFFSFLALPIFGGSTTSANLILFTLTWVALVASHDALALEIGGTLLVRALFFLMPALGSLSFDLLAPGLSKSIKAHGSRQLPARLGRDKLVEVVLVSLFNVLLGTALQAVLEVVATDVIHLRSNLRVTALPPLPWTIAKHLLLGLILRNTLRYFLHRHALHTRRGPLRSWHETWQHSVTLPFSLVAAYDHPVNYLLVSWLPTFLPAYLLRFHVLTYHFFVAIASLEDLFLYSGYAVLPSAIMLTGMARRTDEHFEAFSTKGKGKATGNFGATGLLDLVCGTALTGEDDLVDDLQTEGEKHSVRERMDAAIDGAKGGTKDGEEDADGAAPPRRSGRGKNKKT